MNLDIALPPKWTEQAVCAQVDPAIFYPETVGGTSRPAKRVCEGCPVTAECLSYALENRDDFGVWGGTTWRERRQIRRNAA